MSFLSRTVAATCFVLLACNNEATSDTDIATSTIHANATDTIVLNQQPLLQEGCYQMTFKRDTARLQFQLHDSTITGHLTYRRYEKDNNTGDIKGVIRDSIIVADYTFQSEGMTSVREVRFKIGSGELWQATGPITIVNDKEVYANKDSLDYRSMAPFVKVPCTPAF